VSAILLLASHAAKPENKTAKTTILTGVTE
jgi:hypothetical protein